MKKIYFIGIISITLIVLYLYILSEHEHKKELEKIKQLEIKLDEEQKQLELIRSKTTPCSISDLNDPKSCYHNSNYTCTWNYEAKRCDMK